MTLKHLPRYYTDDPLTQRQNLSKNKIHKLCSTLDCHVPHSLLCVSSDVTTQRKEKKSRDVFFRFPRNSLASRHKLISLYGSWLLQGKRANVMWTSTGSQHVLFQESNEAGIIPMSAQEIVVTGYDELMSVFLSLCPLLLLDPQLDCDLLSLELNSGLDWGGGFSSEWEWKDSL